MKSHSSSEFVASMVNALLPLADVACLIEGGSSLALAGTAKALAQLPKGNWIGGTTPYFMTEKGGQLVSDDLVFVSDLSSLGDLTVRTYGEEELERISAEVPDSGFGMVIIPAESNCHSRFALEAPFFPQTFLKPVVGWIAGFDLTKGGPALVYDGTTGTAHEERAVVAHITWHDGKLAIPMIVNPFHAGDGEVINFSKPGFVQDTCVIDGVEIDFAGYLREMDLEQGDLPLVGDYSGAGVNVSIQQIDAEGRVCLFAPVFPGVDYRFAAPIGDYTESLRSGIAEADAATAFWSCNCILNYLFGELEGRVVGGIAGPITFGEIAYQLLNQTYVTVKTI